MDLSREYTLDGGILRERRGMGASSRGILDFGRPLFLGGVWRSWEAAGGTRFGLGGRPTGLGLCGGESKAVGGDKGALRNLGVCWSAELAVATEGASLPCVSLCVRLTTRVQRGRRPLRFFRGLQSCSGGEQGGLLGALFEHGVGVPEAGGRVGEAVCLAESKGDAALGPLSRLGLGLAGLAVFLLSPLEDSSAPLLLLSSLAGPEGGGHLFRVRSLGPSLSRSLSRSLSPPSDWPGAPFDRLPGEVAGPRRPSGAPPALCSEGGRGGEVGGGGQVRCVCCLMLLLLVVVAEPLAPFELAVQPLLPFPPLPSPPVSSFLGGAENFSRTLSRCRGRPGGRETGVGGRVGRGLDGGDDAAAALFGARGSGRDGLGETTAAAAFALAGMVAEGALRILPLVDFEGGQVAMSWASFSVTVGAPPFRTPLSFSLWPSPCGDSDVLETPSVSQSCAEGGGGEGVGEEEGA